MKIPLYYLVIISCLVYNFSIGQDRQEETFAKFIITDASRNGADITPHLLDAEAYSVFYSYENDDGLYMANVWPKKNSQSYGPMYSFTIEEEKHTYEDYQADYFFFNWRYINDYDKKKGTAKVSVIKIYKPQGVVYIMKMVTETLDIIVYKGYLEGSLNFSTFE